MNGLHLASKEGHINVVQELLARAASVDSSTKASADTTICATCHRVDFVQHWLTGGTPLGCRRRGPSCSPVGVKNQNGVDVQAISILAIGFPLSWN